MSGAFLGIYTPPAPFEMSALDTYTAVAAKPPAIVMWYQAWAGDSPHQFDPAMCVSLYERNSIPMITWEPWDPGANANFVTDPQGQSRFRLQNIVSGKFDPYIQQFAISVAAVRGPVMIRLMHEMNGNWYPWGGTVNGNTPALYVAAWRHIHDIFVREGASNVTWVWSVNGDSVPNVPGNSYSAYYPGDSYVDWTSISAFNWGTTSPVQTWRSFNSLYAAPLAYLKTLHKPIVISEFGVVEQGGDKAAWLTDAYSRIRTAHAEVSGIVYFNSLERGPTSTQDWRITTSPSSTSAYKAAISDPYFVGGPAPTLAGWASGLTPRNWVYLRQLKPVY